MTTEHSWLINSSSLLLLLLSPLSPPLSLPLTLPFSLYLSLSPLPISPPYLLSLLPSFPSLSLSSSPPLPKVSMILDPQSEGSKVLDYVRDLLSQMEQLQERAFTYRSYQKSFKVCPVLLLLRTQLKKCHLLGVARILNLVILRTMATQ